MVLRQSEIQPFDRGSGVKTIPLLGKWNAEGNQVTTGITIFGPGTGIPLHTHNVEETVLILEGDALVELGEQTLELTEGDATWAPAGVPHRFATDAHLLGLRGAPRHAHQLRDRGNRGAPVSGGPRRRT